MAVEVLLRFPARHQVGRHGRVEQGVVDFVMPEVPKLVLASHRERELERVLAVEAAQLGLQAELHADAEGQCLGVHFHRCRRGDGRERCAGARKQEIFESALGCVLLLALLEYPNPVQCVFVNVTLVLCLVVVLGRRLRKVGERVRDGGGHLSWLGVAPHLDVRCRQVLVPLPRLCGQRRDARRPPRRHRPPLSEGAPALHKQSNVP